MKRVTPEEWRSAISAYDADALPFPLLPASLDFEKSSGNRLLILRDEDSDIYIHLAIRTAFFFREARFLFRPFSLSGMLFDEKELLEKVVQFLKKSGDAHRIVPNQHYFLFNEVPKDSASVAFGLLSVDLQVSEDEIFMKMSSNYRNEIRKISSRNPVMRFGRDAIDDFYKLHVQTCIRELQWISPRSYFENLMQVPGRSVFCAVSYEEDIPAAAALVTGTGYAAHYLYGAVAENAAPGAMKHLLWEVFKKLRNEHVPNIYLGGMRMFTPAGSKYDRIQDFKKRFGASVESGFLWKRDLHLFSCILYDILTGLRFFISGKKKTPDLVTQELKNQRNENR